MKKSVIVFMCCYWLVFVNQALGFTIIAPQSAEMVTIDNGVRVWNYRQDYVYAGLPEALQGVPGIRFQGNTSAANPVTDFVQIELHQTSDVYIFWWVDYGYPEWLENAFEVTDWQCVMGGYTFNILHARFEAGIYAFGVTNDTNWRDWYSLAVSPVAEEEEDEEVLSVNLIQSPSMPKEGDQVLLIAEVWNSSGSVTFAWYFNDVLIVGETDSIYTQSSVSSSNAGMYRVEATDDNTTVSDELLLTIYEALPLSTNTGIVALCIMIGLVMIIQRSKLIYRI